MFRIEHFLRRFVPILWTNFLYCLPNQELVSRFISWILQLVFVLGNIIMFFYGLHSTVIWYQHRDMLQNNFGYNLGLVAYIFGYIAVYVFGLWISITIYRVIRNSIQDYRHFYKHKDEMET